MSSAVCKPATVGTDIDVVTVNEERRLRLRFPDTDPDLAPDDDLRTFVGPTTIAVTPAGDPIPCALAAVGGSCAGVAGTIACIDALSTDNGGCESGGAEPRRPRPPPRGPTSISSAKRLEAISSVD